MRAFCLNEPQEVLGEEVKDGVDALSDNEEENEPAADVDYDGQTEVINF